MRAHELKAWRSYFEALWDGRKPFELRRNDREFRPGDRLVVREFDNSPSGGGYMGRHIEAEVSYVLVNCESFGLMEGYAILGLKNIIRYSN